MEGESRAKAKAREERKGKEKGVSQAPSSISAPLIFLMELSNSALRPFSTTVRLNGGRKVRGERLPRAPTYLPESVCPESLAKENLEKVER